MGESLNNLRLATRSERAERRKRMVKDLIQHGHTRTVALAKAKQSIR